MATVQVLPGFVTELHGSLSSDSKYYFKTRNGKICMYEKPRRRVVPPKTSPQIAARERFKQAQAAINVLCQNELVKRWAGRLWQSHKNKYGTLRGWLFAELMKQ